MSEDILELDGIQTGVLFLRVAGSQNISRLTQVFLYQNPFDILIY